jgi:tripartite-type tricarboxylate transporter receptor subunit TctC
MDWCEECTVSISPQRIVFAYALALAANSALAQDWPAKPVHWIVPFPPGGSTDIAVRTVADRLTQVFGQPMIVENRPGAAGHIGFEYVAKSPADGYTILAASDGIASAPHLYSKLGFDPLRDFAPVTQLSRQPVLLATHPSLGVHSVTELVALAKTKPGLPYATSGSGSPQHIVAEWFANLAGIKLTHVPYKGGGQAIADLVGGHVLLASLGPGPLLPFYTAGKVKLLAQSPQTRVSALPEVPTYEEAGFKGLILEQWFGVFLPAGTPVEIVVRLNREIVKALADPQVRERYAQSGLDPVGNTPEQFAAVVRSDYEKYGRLVRELKIKID